MQMKGFLFLLKQDDFSVILNINKRHGGKAMNTESQGRKRVEFRLSPDDVTNLFGSYEAIDYNDPKTKASLNMLYNRAIKNGDIPPDGRRLTIEVKPFGGGCTVTFISEAKGRLRLKYAKVKGYILTFFSADDMLDAAARLYTYAPKLLNSSLLKLGDAFALVIKTSLDLGPLLLHIAEYCITAEQNDLKVSHWEEYGEAIVTKRAIEKIGAAFKATLSP